MKKLFLSGMRSVVLVVFGIYTVLTVIAPKNDAIAMLQKVEWFSYLKTCGPGGS